MKPKNQKIAVFYLICQLKPNWKEHYYIPQMQRLMSSGLYDKIDFIDIHVSCGKEVLTTIPNKTRKIEYTARNDKLDEFTVLENIHDFSRKNYEYNILYFHSSGAATLNDDTYKKDEYRDYMEYCNIDLWKECNILLNFYDTVGTDFVKNTWFAKGDLCFHSPHYTGNFWWTTSSYFRTLDLDYLKQNVEWKRYLAEFFISSANGKHYSIHNSNQNVYENFIKYDKEEILDSVNNELKNLWKAI